MQDQREIQRMLTEKLTEARMRNGSYSVRAFSQKLGVSSSSLSEILNGKRRISKKLAQRFVENLCLDPAEARRILDLFATKKGYKKLKNTKLQQMLQLDMDHFKTISDWYHFAILSLSETQNFQSEASWIAKRLGINQKEAKLALDRLERLKLLKRNRQGKLEWAQQNYTTSDGVANLSIRKGHAQNLELAKSSLEQDPVESRDFTAMTMAIDPAKLPEAKVMIREFRDRLCGFLESGKKTEVYKICIQTIPLTKIVND